MPVDERVQNFTQLATEPTTDDSLVMVNRNTNEGEIIDYNLLADKILDKIATKQYSSLATASKLLPGAINELDADISDLGSWTKLLYGGEYLSSVDMNTLTTPGNYYLVYAAAQASSNLPVKSACRIVVSLTQAKNSPNYIMQEVTYYHTRDPIFYRKSTDGGSTWGGWSSNIYLFNSMTTDASGNAAGFLNANGIYIVGVTHPTDDTACYAGLFIRRKDGVPFAATGGGNKITAGSTNSSGTVVFKYNNTNTAGLICNAYRLLPINY